MKKNRIWILLGITLVICLFIIFLNNKKNDVVSVKVNKVNKGEITRYINTIGVVKSNEVKDYYSSQLKIININFKVGDLVNKGDVLANLEIGTIVSDIEGVVTAINGTEGSYGEMNRPLITIQNLENLKLTVALTQNDAKDIELNQKSIIKSGTTDINGEVSFINPIAISGGNPVDGEAYLNIDISNLDSKEGLIIGFNNEVDILVGEEKEILTVKAEALKIEKGNKKYLFVVKDNIVEKREVKVGLQGDSDIQILEGVDEGEEVILNPLGNLDAGTVIKVSSNK